MKTHVIDKSRFPFFYSIVEEKMAQLEAISRDRNANLNKIHILVSWGGGKDSTIALMIAKELANRCNGQISSYTMAHSGLTDGVIKNIVKIRDDFEIRHEFRHFGVAITSPFHERLKEWHTLYQGLWRCLPGVARFMCVACNMGSIVTEYNALSQSSANIHITGNPDWEHAQFAKWLDTIKTDLKHITFHAATGIPKVDYYLAWWDIYYFLLKEVAAVNSSELDADNNFNFLKSRFLYNLPTADSPVRDVVGLCVLESSQRKFIEQERIALLECMGWALPADIQGGTESDCQHTAAIARLNIEQKGIKGHLDDLRKAELKFNPLPEMASRANEWALNGNSERVGKDLLQEMEIPELDANSSTRSAPVAKILADLLFPIR